MLAYITIVQGIYAIANDQDINLSNIFEFGFPGVELIVGVHAER